ncbi:MAG: flagellar biosynthetic protein FliO [Bacillota bacterium]
MQTLISAVIFLVVFGSILFLAYATTKYIGTRTSKIMKGKHIDIIETVSLGFDSRLHLVKAGEEFVLISSSGKNVQLLTTVRIDNYSADEEKLQNGTFNFKEVFDKYIQGFKGRQNNNKSFTESLNSESKSNSENEVFRHNLVKLRTITSGIEKHMTVDGDEYTNEK